MGFLNRLLKKDGPPDNRMLERALHDLAQTDTPERRRAFYDLIKQSTLILATPHENPENRVRVSDGTLQIGFIATTDSNQKSAMLAFTSEAALLAWRPAGCAYTTLSSRVLFQTALQKEMETIILNPSGPAGGYLTRMEFTALAEGLFPGAQSQNLPNQEILITSPSLQPPDPWIALLRSQARTMSSILGLVLVTASIGGGPPHYLVGVDLAAGASPDEIIPKLLDAIRPNIERDAYVDFVPLGGNALTAEIRSKGLQIL